MLISDIFKNICHALIFTIIFSRVIIVVDAISCPANTFALNGNTCVPVPPNAISDPGSNRWQCGDGSIGTYGIRRIETTCSNYTFSNTLNNKS